MAATNYLAPLFDEVEKALQAKLYLIALFTTLTIPDICSALESNTPDKNVGDRYRNWCNKHIDISKFSLISTDDIYEMRCKALHNGQMKELKKRSTIKDYVLVVPNQGITIVNCKANDTYLYSVEEFCREILKAGYTWSESHKDDPGMSEKMEKILRYHSNGISPIIVGVPVIA